LTCGSARRANSLWVSFAVSAQHGAAAPAGIVAPDGRWAARYADDGRPAVAVADIDNRAESIEIAVAKARPWRRRVRPESMTLTSSPTTAATSGARSSG
jgi:hypothetical protein